MIRQASPGDLPALQAFLRGRQATSMFLSGNLQDHGLNANGHPTGHPKAMTLWLAEQDSAVQAVFGCTEQGIVLCEAPVFDPGWSAGLRRAMAGRRVIAMNGEAGQATALRCALGLDAHPASFEDIEPLFQLRLDDLRIPDGATQLRNITDADTTLVTDWRFAFDCEVFGEGALPETRQRSQSRALDLVRTGRGRLLIQDDQVVAMTAFNAVLPDIVQIGSVYTPPALRGQGHARRAVALHLAQARRQGVESAILFASGPAAVSAYQSIGFVRIGDYAQIDFAHPARIGDPA